MDDDRDELAERLDALVEAVERDAASREETGVVLSALVSMVRSLREAPPVPPIDAAITTLLTDLADDVRSLRATRAEIAELHAELAAVREELARLKRRIAVRASAKVAAHLDDETVERLAAVVVERLTEAFEVVDSVPGGG